MESSSCFGFNCGKKTPEDLLIGCSAPQHTALNTPEGSPELILSLGFLLLSNNKVTSAHCAGGKLAGEVIIS